MVIVGWLKMTLGVNVVPSSILLDLVSVGSINESSLQATGPLDHTFFALAEWIRLSFFIFIFGSICF